MLVLRGVKNKESRCQYSTGILYLVISKVYSCFSISVCKDRTLFPYRQTFLVKFLKTAENILLFSSRTPLIH